MSLRERFYGNHEMSSWQSDIELAHMFLLQDQARFLDSEPGSFEEEGLALRISKRLGNFTESIIRSGKKSLSEPRYPFPNYIEIERIGNITYRYLTRENEVREAEILKHRFGLGSIDYSGALVIPPERWGKDQIFVAKIDEVLLSLLKYTLRERLLSQRNGI
jgi:hypothetical protein